MVTTGSEGVPKDGRHLDPATIAAHVERRLPRVETARVEEHLAACSACYECFAETVRFQLEEEEEQEHVSSPGVVVRLWRRRAARVAVACALAAALAVASWPLWRAHLRSAAPSLVADLVRAVGGQRFLEPRLTGGFRYGRFVRLRSGDTPRGLDAQPPSVIAAVARIRERAETDTSPEALSALAITYLVSGDVDAAVKALESAAAMAPKDARIQSDLAAAYLARASRLDEPADIPRGLEAAEKAVALPGAPAEAWFNRALALEGLHLVDEARKAWEDYLKRDPASAWAEEARRRLAELPVPRRSSVEEDHARVRAALDDGKAAVDRLADESPTIVREYFDDELLGAWAEAQVARRRDARLLRERAGIVGDAVLRATGDALPRDAALALDSPPSATCHDPPGTQALGYRLLREAQRRNEVQQRSCDAFREAHRLLSLGGSPYSEWARERIVAACLYPKQPKPALAELGRIESVAERRAYVRLLGRVRWMQGLVHAGQGDLTASLEPYRRARAIFHGLRDTEIEAFLLMALAEDFDGLGEARVGWRERVASLALLDDVRDPRRRHAILEVTALACLAEGLLRAALHVQTALVELDRRWSNPTALSDALTKRSSIRHALGSTDAAERDIADARGFISRIADGDIAEAASADADAAEGSLLVRREPERGVDLVRRALAHYERALPIRVPGLRLLVARAQAARGLPDAAEAELLAGIRLLEAQRASLHDLALQASFFEQALPLFDDMVALQLDERHDPASALSFVERGRGRQLVDSLADALPPARPGRPGTPEAAFEPAALQRELPAGVALVYYVCLDRRLLAFLLTRDDLRLVEQAVSEAETSRLVAAQRAALERRASLASVQRAGARLHDVLVRPLSPFPASVRALVFVPDAALHGVSFAALWDRAAGRYLAEEYLLGLSPSGRVLVGHSGASIALPASPRALVVGNPRVDSATWPGLAALPAAEREAAEVAALYAAPELLTGAAATKAAFLEALGRSDVVHYAGHAAAVADDPASSRLLLAADPGVGDSGALDLRELPSRAPRARLVVLAACRTAAGAVSRVEGALSLSRPFLAAGVPNVVGSLWDVDDEVSRTVFVTFHRSLLSGREPARALHETQLSLLHGGDPTLSHPSTWAGFVSIGALRGGPR